MAVDAPSPSEFPQHPELELFLSIVPSLPKSTPVLTFWKAQADVLPKLAKLARKVLGIPATQTPSERVFSLMRRIFHHLRGSLDPETVNKQLTHSFYVRRRNLALLEEKRQNRSQKSIDADAKRQESRNEVSKRKALLREGDYTETAHSAPTALQPPPTDDLQEQIDYLTQVEEAFEDLDDGERESDGDFDPEDHDELSEDDPTQPPPPKRSKRGELTTTETGQITQVNLYPCSVNKDLIIGIFNSECLGSPPTLDKMFGGNCQYVEDFKWVHPDSSRRYFSIKLSATGRKKFKTGRRGALSLLGEIIQLDLSISASPS